MEVVLPADGRTIELGVTAKERRLLGDVHPAWRRVQRREGEVLGDQGVRGVASEPTGESVSTGVLVADAGNTSVPERRVAPQNATALARPANHRVRYLHLAVVNIALVTSLLCDGAIVRADTFAYEDYRPASIARVVSVMEAETAEVPESQTAMVVEQTVSKYVVRVEWTGQHRRVPRHVAAVTEQWIRMHGVDWTKLFQDEIGVREGQASFWIPIQRQVYEPLAAEGPKGVLVDLYLIHAGSVAGDHVFLATAYQTIGYRRDVAMSSIDIDELIENVEELRNVGRLRDAIEVNKRVIAIIEAHQGCEHEECAHYLNDLAELYHSTGDYVDAAVLYRRALAISERTQSGWDLTTVVLSNLGGLEEKMGDYVNAGRHSRRALATYKRAISEEDEKTAAMHERTAGMLSNLAGIYNESGDYERAILLERRALKIYGMILDPTDRRQAAELNNLAVYYDNVNDREAARRLYFRSYDIVTRTLNPRDPDMAMSLMNIARVYGNAGHYDLALRLFRRAVAILKRSLGTNQPRTADALRVLAQFYDVLGDYGRAELFYRRALDVMRQTLELTSGIQAERQQLAMVAKYRQYLDRWLTVTTRTHVAGATVAHEILYWKAAVTIRQRLARDVRYFSRSGDAKVRETYVRLDDVARRLAQAALAEYDAAKSADQRQRELRSLVAEREADEQELARVSVQYARRRAPLRRTILDIQHAIPQDGVLVDFIEYAYASPRKEDGGERRLTAVVLRASGAPLRVELGPVAPIARAIDEWRRIYGEGLVGENAGRALGELIWQPLADTLGDAEVILISPDGALSRFPFGAMRVGNPEQYLLEHRVIATIPIPRLLPELRRARGERTPRLLAVGGVDFGPTPASSPSPSAAAVPNASAQVVDRSGPYGDRQKWPALPNTGPEVNTICDLFQAEFPSVKPTQLRGRAASEGAIRERAHAATYIHLATHGYFAAPELTATQTADADSTEERGRFDDRDAWDPGLLSGIVLADANDPPDSEGHDGILTALEVSELELTQAKLVVLSACETGLGPVAGGEAILGLQRAFTLAGAESVVATLWSISDAGTPKLMELFYRNLWKYGMSRGEALQQAQISMLSGPSNLPPYEWAPFVLSGAWE